MNFHFRLLVLAKELKIERFLNLAELVFLLVMIWQPDNLLKRRLFLFII